MPKWTDYTIKTEPADKDEVMILDTSGKANKRLGLSALSDWIIGKIANKVFENLQTQNKTILGAINELNSNQLLTYGENIYDLNNPPSAFILNTGINPKGLPNLGGNGCCVIQHNPGSKMYSAQLAFSFGSDKIAIRRKKDSGWTDWAYFSVQQIVSCHNIPRIVPKDITSYYNDGSLWKRLEGTGGYSLFEDLFVGDYIKMSRPISASNPVAEYQLTGSQYVTIASLGGLAGNGDNTSASDKWAVMVPGMGFGGTQHFGRSRMNPTNTTEGAYKGSEMNTKVIGAVATTGSTAAGATINQQLFAEFGSHLKTTRELITNGINATGANKFGAATGCSNNYEWLSMQAVLMSEIEVYGSCVFSSSGYDTGTANHQFELFTFSKNAINNRSAWYSLKDVASASQFCRCGNNGISYYGSASDASIFVRLRFVIGA